jgi:hypothetical protein
MGYVFIGIPRGDQNFVEPFDDPPRPLRIIGRAYNESATFFEHPGHLPKRLIPRWQVLDNLRTDHAIKATVLKGESIYGGMDNRLTTLPYVAELVHGNIKAHGIRQVIEDSAGAAAHIQTPLSTLCQLDDDVTLTPLPISLRQKVTIVGSFIVFSGKN